MLNLQLINKQYYDTLALFEGYLNDLSENRDLTAPENEWLAVNYQRQKDIYNTLVSQGSDDTN